MDDWGDFNDFRLGLVTPPPSVSHSMSDYSDSAASGSTFSLSSFGGAESISSLDDTDHDTSQHDLSLAYTLNRDLNFNSAPDLSAAHSHALYRSLEHELSLDPSLAQSLASFSPSPETPPISTSSASSSSSRLSGSGSNPSVSFPATLPTPSVTFPANVTSSHLHLSRTRSREVAFAHHPSLSMDRDRDRTLDATLALDRDRDRTLGRELSLDRERDLTFKSTTSTAGSGKRKGFKDIVKSVKEWGKRKGGKEREKEEPPKDSGAAWANRKSGEVRQEGGAKRGVQAEVKEEAMDDVQLSPPESPPNEPSPEGARSIEELLWETVEEVEEMHSGGVTPAEYYAAANGDGSVSHDFYPGTNGTGTYDATSPATYFERGFPTISGGGGGTSTYPGTTSMNGEAKVDRWRNDLSTTMAPSPTFNSPTYFPSSPPAFSGSPTPASASSPSYPGGPPLSSYPAAATPPREEEFDYDALFASSVPTSAFTLPATYANFIPPVAPTLQNQTRTLDFREPHSSSAPPPAFFPLPPQSVPAHDYLQGVGVGEWAGGGKLGEGDDAMDLFARFGLGRASSGGMMGDEEIEMRL